MHAGRNISRLVFASIAVLALSDTATNAAILYQYPDPISSSPGDVNAWTLNSPFAVADTFTLSTDSNLSSVDFLAWNFTGDQITAIDWRISDSPNGGTPFGIGTASVTDVRQGANF